MRGPSMRGKLSIYTCELAGTALMLFFGVAAVAFLWGAAENLVAAALKAGPFGQLAGQRILLAAQDTIGAAAKLATTLDDDELWTSAPGLAIASARHETQYSRLFRS